MVLSPAAALLGRARADGYALPAFNVNDLSFAQAVIAAAEEENAPLFVALSEGAIAYGGRALAEAVLRVVADAGVPAAVHLDHGKTLETAKQAVAWGFNSVMVDGSLLSYDENVALVAAATDAFGPRGVTVEGELGHVGGRGDPSVFTEPEMAAAFVAATGADSLAVAVGTSHGAYKFVGEPTIDLTRLGEIRAAVSVPLVLHGASAVYADAVEIVERYGGRFGGARGLPDVLLGEAVARGVAKVNVDTDLRLAFVASVRTTFATDAAALDPKKILGKARDAIRETARRKIGACGAAGRAK